jgi:hypothetical protein
LTSDADFWKSGYGKENKSGLTGKKNKPSVVDRIAETLAGAGFGGIISIVSFRKQ